jgi:GAF domain-containing protein
MSQPETTYVTLLDRLRIATDASRTTLRLVTPNGPKLVAESVSPGTYRMAADRQENAAQFPTYEYLERTRDLLIQSDLRADPVRPPRSLIDRYRVLAQMLAPILVDDQVTGVISVHIVGETRAWSPAHVAALRDYRDRIARLVSADCSLVNS